MATAMVQDVYFRLNSDKSVDIVADGKIVETTTLAQAAQRLSYHRNQAAQRSGQTFVETRARKRARA